MLHMLCKKMHMFHPHIPTKMGMDVSEQGVQTYGTYCTQKSRMGCLLISLLDPTEFSVNMSGWSVKHHFKKVCLRTAWNTTTLDLETSTQLSLIHVQREKSSILHKCRPNLHAYKTFCNLGGLKTSGHQAINVIGSYLFQWVFEFRYKDGNMMGKIFAALSLIKLIIYSLFQ